MVSFLLIQVLEKIIEKKVKHLIKETVLLLMMLQVKTKSIVNDEKNSNDNDIHYNYGYENNPMDMIIHHNGTINDFN